MKSRTLVVFSIAFSLLAIACDRGKEKSRPDTSSAANGQQAVPRTEVFVEATDLPEFSQAWSAIVQGGVPRELDLSPDGQLVLTRGDDDRVVCTRISDGAQRWSAQAPEAFDIGFSVDGSFAYAGRFAESPLAWDSSTGEPLEGWQRLDLNAAVLWSGIGDRFLFLSFDEGSVAWQAGAFRPPPEFSGQRFRFSSDARRLALWSIETSEHDERDQERHDTLSVSVHEIPSGNLAASFKVSAKRYWDVPPLSFAAESDLEHAAVAAEGQVKIYSLRSGEIVSRFGSEVRLVGGGGPGEWVTWSIRGTDVEDDFGRKTWRVRRCVELWRDAKSALLAADVPDVVEMWIRPFGVVALLKKRSLGACDAGGVESTELRFLPREGVVEQAWFGRPFHRCALPAGDSIMWTSEGVVFGIERSSQLRVTSSSTGFQSDPPDALRKVRSTATRAVAVRGTDIVTQEIDKEEIRVIPSPHGAEIDQLVVEDGALVARCWGRTVAWSPADGRLLGSVDRKEVTWSRGAFRDSAEKRPYARSRNGRFVADLQGDTIVVRDLDSAATVGRFLQEGSSYTALLSDDGALLFDFWDDPNSGLCPRLRSTLDGKTTATSDDRFYWNTIGWPRFSPDSRFLLLGNRPVAVYDLNLRRIASLETSVNLHADSKDQVFNCRFLENGRLLNLLDDGSLQMVDLSTGAVAGSVRCIPDTEEAKANHFLVSVDPRFALVTFADRSRHRVVDLARMETCSSSIASLWLSGGACFAGPQRIAAIEFVDESGGEESPGLRFEIRIRGLKGTPLQSIPWREVKHLRGIDETGSFAAGGKCEVRVYSAGR